MKKSFMFKPTQAISKVTSQTSSASVIHSTSDTQVINVKSNDVNTKTK